MTKYIYYIYEVEKARLRNFYLTQELRERFYSWNEIVEVVDLKKTKKGQKAMNKIDSKSGIFFTRIPS